MRCSVLHHVDLGRLSMLCIPDAERAAYTWPGLYMAWLIVASTQGREAAGGHLGRREQEAAEAQGRHTSLNTSYGSYYMRCVLLHGIVIFIICGHIVLYASSTLNAIAG